MSFDRPTMRRKSSAQNLLSNFKTRESGSSAPPPTASFAQIQAIQAAQSGGQSWQSGLPSSTGSTFSYAQTPTTATMPGRDWDVQSHTESMFSDRTLIGSSAPPSIISAGTVGDPARGIPDQPGRTSQSPAIPQGTSMEYLREIVQKRIITLTYMRNVHDGRSHWFHTIVMSRADLDRVFNNTAMKKRTYSFTILGMSLSNLFDIPSAQDLLRGLLSALNEYENSKGNKEDSERPRMQRLFRAGRKGRPAGGNMGDYAMSSYAEDQTSYLITPHMPFPLDYNQVLLSLLDVLSEVYNKIAKILGPSIFPHTQMMGPLGALSPHPGVSYLFANAPFATLGGAGAPSIDGLPSAAPSHVEREKENEQLWGIANANNAALPGPQFSGGGIGASGPTTTAFHPSYGDMIQKIDGKLKKIISQLLKELDQFARNGIKDEIATLAPLLRNSAVADDGREQFDFEGNV